MTDALLPPQSLAQEVQNVGAALHELVIATRRLVTALASRLLKRNSTPCRRSTAAEEANQLRAIADEWAKTDPRYAQDLYAAADRHELAPAPDDVSTP